jgi:hypothetical protein
MTPEPSSGSIATGVPVQPLYDPQRLAALAAQGPREPARAGIGDYGVAALVCFLVALGFVAYSRAVAHWFLLPLMVCGTLIGSDAVRWVRGVYDTFDPKGLTGLFGFHYFFVAPLLFVALGGEMTVRLAPTYWPPWLGLMAVLNSVGLLLYKISVRWGSRGVKRYRMAWTAVPGRTTAFLGGGVLVSFLCVCLLFAAFGGFAGMAAANTEKQGAFAGFGVPRIVADALGMLTFLVIAAHRQQRPNARAGTAIVAVILLAVFAVQFIVVGGATSRGASLTAAVWALVTMHYLWGRVGRGTLLALVVPALVFLWLMGLYKHYGTRVIEYVETGSQLGDLSTEANRTVPGMLIGDLSRTDVHACLLHSRVRFPGESRLWYGRTYATAIIPMIPRWLWADRPGDAGKVRAGTDAQQGRGYFREYSFFRSTRAYGIAGEAILNFGPLAVPLAYGVLGWLVGRHRRSLRAVQPGDFRAVWLAYWTYFLVNMLLWDSDNYIAFMVMRAGFVVVVIYVATVRRPVVGAPAAV